jgi:hypothetical protein
MAGKLSPRARRILVVAAVIETLLKLAVLLDLRHRPQEQIRGRKRAWKLGLLINSAGIIPISYFVWGRHPKTPAD